VRTVALAGIEIEPGTAQPADGKIFERVSDLEDPQCLAGELLALILRRTRELELQSALTAVSKAGAAQIVAGRPRRLIGGERPIDGGVDPVGKAGTAVIVQHADLPRSCGGRARGRSSRAIRPRAARNS